MELIISSQVTTSSISPIVSPAHITPVPSMSPFSKNILQAVEPATYSRISSNLHFSASLARTFLATALFYILVEFLKLRSRTHVSISVALFARCSLTAGSTGHSLDSRKRVPRYTPCAPSISAAAICRPVPCSRRRQGEDNFRVRRSGGLKIHPKKDKTCTFCAGLFQRDLALFRLIHI